MHASLALALLVSLSVGAPIDGFMPLAEALPAPAPQCSNEVDDDGDGRIDAADQQCRSGTDNDESRP